MLRYLPNKARILPIQLNVRQMRQLSHIFSDQCPVRSHLPSHVSSCSWIWMLPENDALEHLHIINMSFNLHPRLIDGQFLHLNMPRGKIQSERTQNMRELPYFLQWRFILEENRSRLRYFLRLLEWNIL
ncbi:Hypothetical_protein [Hexamita inflata]|uniref:Hypothetical_protein n=1 Tax=Hexamita inflata TaxID=28002 RepID=A0AA86QMR7_9EUKA|nr:Hypothetical protein HINF_LOCUS44708 [Hexamita inflata]